MKLDVSPPEIWQEGIKKAIICPNKTKWNKPDLSSYFSEDK